MKSAAQVSARTGQVRRSPSQGIKMSSHLQLFNGSPPEVEQPQGEFAEVMADYYPEYRWMMGTYASERFVDTFINTNECDRQCKVLEIAPGQFVLVQHIQVAESQAVTIIPMGMPKVVSYFKSCALTGVTPVTVFSEKSQRLVTIHLPTDAKDVAMFERFAVQSAQNDDGSLAEHLPDLALSVLFGSTSSLVQGARVKEWFITLISPATELGLN